MGAAGVAIAGLQLKGATGVAAGVAVFFAITRLPFRAGVALAGAVTVALGVVTAIAGSSSSAVAAEVLVTVLLGVVAQFLKQSRESQDQTELLLAELEDARDEQARAAAIAERGRIAGELHDVLAHSLSGAAIQLQGARKLADREHASAASQRRDRPRQRARQGRTCQRPPSRRHAARRPAAYRRPASSADRELQGRHEPRRDAADRRRVPDAPGRSEPRALPRRAGSADERRALRAERVHDGHLALRT